MKEKNGYLPSVKLQELFPLLNETMQKQLVERYGEEMPEVEVKRIAVGSTAQSVEKGKRQAKVLFSTRDMDRDKEVILSNGWDLSDYQKSGVILDSHNYDSIEHIVANTVSLFKDEKQLGGVIEYMPTPIGETGWILAQNMPVQFSVGFIPLDVIDSGHADWAKTVEGLAADDTKFRKNRDKVKRIIRKALLLEVSQVGVPSNVNALRQEVSKQLTAGAITGEQAQLCIKAFEAVAETKEPEEKPKVNESDPPEEKGEKPPEVELVEAKLSNPPQVRVVGRPRVLKQTALEKRAIKVHIEKLTGKV